MEPHKNHLAILQEILSSEELENFLHCFEPRPDYYESAHYKLCTKPTFIITNSLNWENSDNEYWENVLLRIAFKESPERVHDWRNHVPDEVIRMWDELSIDAKMVVKLMADDLAQAEEWE